MFDVLLIYCHKNILFEMGGVSILKVIKLKSSTSTHSQACSHRDVEINHIILFINTYTITKMYDNAWIQLFSLRIVHKKYHFVVVTSMKKLLMMLNYSSQTTLI